MFLEKIVWLNYILHYLYQSQTSNMFIFITFLANLEANLQMWKNIMLQMLFLQTIIKMCLWTGRSQCDTKWCSMFEFMETFLHTVPNWKSVMAIMTSCLTTSDTNIGRLYALGRKMATGNAENGQKEPERTKWILLLRGSEEGVVGVWLLFHPAHVSDCPRSTTYAICSQSVRSSSLMATGI